MEPIFLYPDTRDDCHVITFGRSEDLLCTPNGNIIKSDNERLIENLVFDLQKHSELTSEKNNSLSGAPLETVCLYSLVCTQIDFWSDRSKTIELEDMIKMLTADPVANISPGPEQVDQIHQWRSVTKILHKNKISFHDIQYFIEDRSEIETLAGIIKRDFDTSTNFERAAFIQLNHLLRAPICVWAFIYQELSQSAFATALSETANFILSVQEVTQEKLRDICPEGLTEDEIEEFEDQHYQKVEKTARIEVYEEIGKLLSTVQEFLKISKPSVQQLEKISDILREESISHEFKASLRKPYPDYPELIISKDGKETFTINKQTFLSKKQIHTFFQDIVLKTIASLLNTQGGRLVIGVHEFGNKKEIVGIDREDFQSHDEYERHLTQLMKNAFGASVVADFVTTNIEKVHDEYVCVVTCKRYEGDELVWFQDKLFIRTGPRVDELKGKEQAQFILQRQQHREKTQ